MKTHEQDASGPSEEWREVVRRSADLCRRDPATWAKMVVISDALVAQGMDVLEAKRSVLDDIGA